MHACMDGWTDVLIDILIVSLIAWSVGQLTDLHEGACTLTNSVVPTDRDIVLLRSVRISTWSGEWTYRHWAKRYCVGLEDPFDCTDNCARTIAAHASASVAKAFGRAATSMQVISATAVASESSGKPCLLDTCMPWCSSHVLRHDVQMAVKSGCAKCQSQIHRQQCQRVWGHCQTAVEEELNKVSVMKRLPVQQGQ